LRKHRGKAGKEDRLEEDLWMFWVFLLFFHHFGVFGFGTGTFSGKLGSSLD
jgi:hypothetical protein